MKITRRKAIKLGLAGSGVLLSPLGFPRRAEAVATVKCGSELFPQCAKDTPPSSPNNLELNSAITRFQQPIAIPEPLKPSFTKTYQVTREGRTFDQAIDYYQITMRKQRINLVPSPGEAAIASESSITAEFWTYNGTIPGPYIRQPKNRVSCIRFINELGNDDQRKPICTSVHLHGMASLPQYDGYAEDLTPPQHYKDYYYPNNRASILWYHDHALHNTSRNVYMGLAGMYIVEYAKEDFCHPKDFGTLPSGEFEVPLIIQDKTFTELSNHNKQREWKLVFGDRDQRGIYGDIILINGVPWPHMKVKRQKYYFRILNASASRTYQLTLSGEEVRQTTDADPLTTNHQPVELIVIGTDAGLLDKPVHLSASTQSLPIGVAERYGVVIDFSVFAPTVKHLYLRNVLFPGNLGPHSPALMRFDLEDGNGIDNSHIPSPLGILTDRTELEKRSIQTRTFRFGRSGMWAINGKTWSLTRVDAKPELCGIEIWTLINTGGWTHPVHIHLVDFQILDRNGLPPKPHERGWKDVVLLRDLETVRVVARFAPHRGKYMIHCHNIVHEDHDMMTQFEVVQRVEKIVGGVKTIQELTGDDPCSAPAQPLPPKSALGDRQPPVLIPDQLPCQCFEILPNSCGTD